MIDPIFIPHIQKFSKRFDEPDLLNCIQASLSDKSAFISRHGLSLAINKFIFKGEKLGLHVWLGIALDNQSFIRHFNSTLQSAKAAELKFIQFETKRRGWEKKATQLGFINSGVRDGYTIWTKEVI